MSNNPTVSLASENLGMLSKNSWLCYSYNYGKDSIVFLISWGHHTPTHNLKDISHQVFIINPIFHWPRSQMWQFIRMFYLPYCYKHDKGYNGQMFYYFLKLLLCLMK
jgi:hypothetical protein